MDYQTLDLSKFWLNGYKFEGRFKPVECIKIIPKLLKKEGTANKCKLFDSGLIDKNEGFRNRYELYSKQVFLPEFINEAYLENFYKQSSDKINFDLVKDDELRYGSIWQWRGWDEYFASEEDKKEGFHALGIGFQHGSNVLERPFVLNEIPEQLEKLIPKTKKDKKYKHPGLEITIFDTRMFDGITNRDMIIKDGKHLLIGEQKFYIYKNIRLHYHFRPKTEYEYVGFTCV